MDDNDFLNTIQPQKSVTRRAERRRPSNRVPMSRESANRASGGKGGTKGNFKYQSVRFPIDMFPDIHARVEALSKKHRVPMNDVWMVAVLYGLGDMEGGDLPEIEPAASSNRFVV